MIVLGTSCSVLGYSEESARFNDRDPAVLSSRTITDARSDKVTLVRAAINGEDRGWFLLASGSYFCIIDAAYIPRIEGLSKQDESEIRYPCKLPVTVYRAGSLSVGRLTIKNLDIAALDLSRLIDAVDEEITGIIGYPVFARAVVEIRYGQDGADDRISIFDPDSFELSGGEWQPLGLYNFQPVLQGRINRQHSAPFAIETGASGNVSFYSVFTATHDVNEGRPTVEKTVSTLCGEATELETAVRVFEIAGKTFENLPVTIMQPGSISDVAPGVLGGIVGRGLFEDHVVVFDMKNQRFALVGE